MKNKIVLFTYGNVFWLQENWMRLLSVFPTKLFDDDFMFQLTKSEFENLISKKSTSSWGGRRKPPYAFTEQCIYMLMTVLRGELAVKQSKALIRMFKQMKDFIIENQDFISPNDLVQEV